MLLQYPETTGAAKGTDSCHWRRRHLILLNGQILFPEISLKRQLCYLLVSAIPPGTERADTKPKLTTIRFHRLGENVLED